MMGDQTGALGGRAPVNAAAFEGGDRDSVTTLVPNADRFKLNESLWWTFPPLKKNGLERP
jgi:hypothetical protein